LQVGVLVLEQLVGVQHTRVLVLERRRAHAFGVGLLFEALEATIGIGQAVLQDAFEAGFGVALVAMAKVGVFDASFAAAHAVVEQQTSECEGGGDDGAAAE
jgi:hypothetical protein